MKFLYTQVAVLLAFSAFGQNGITHYAPPPGYTNSQLFKRCIAVDSTGNKWIGFGSIGTGMFNGVSWTMYDSSNGLPDNTVMAIAFSPNGDGWFGTMAGGVARFSNNNWTTYNLSNSALPSLYIKAIATHGNDTWFGTFNSGLAKFDGVNWTVYNTGNSGLADNAILSIAIDANGIAWIGTVNGLSKFDGVNWTTYNDANTPALFSYGDNIRGIVLDSNNQPWFLSSSLLHFMNGNIVALQDYMPCPAIDNMHQIFKGAGGDINLLGFFTSKGQLIVLHQGIPQIYYVPTNGYGVYDPVSAKIWLASYSYNYNGIATFDPSAYTGFGLGHTYDNFKNLDANQVKAAIMNRGDMHWDGSSSPKYEVPKDSGAHSIFASALWIGGLDQGGSLHMAAMTYRQSGMDFWPGPLDTINGATDSSTSAVYDRIWKVDRNQISEFQYYFGNGSVQNGTYIPARDIIEWPAHGGGNYSRNLAPFVDVDGNGIYDPLTGGDYPKIKGDQMLWWVFNDNLAAHTETGGQPLKFEFHASAYVYTCPSIHDSDRVLNYTTLYNFRIFNRSGITYDSVGIGIFQDSDLGAYDDDYVGCYPAGNYGYIYNGDMNDGNSMSPQPGTYGGGPPMMSTVILNGPEADPGDGEDNDNDGITDEPGEKNLMTGFKYYNNDFSSTGNPQSDTNFYSYIRTQWLDGTPQTYGGNGYGGLQVHDFMFDGWPYDTTGWSEETLGNVPSDRRFLLSCGTFTFPPNEVNEFDYALVWSRDTSLVTKSQAYFDNNLRDVNKIKSWFTNGNAPSCMQWTVGMTEQAGMKKTEIFPNPANRNISLAYEAETDQAVYEIIDMTGRRLSAGSLDRTGINVINVEALPPGLYFVRISDGSKFCSAKFVRN
ncbi:MAG: hypothetical protein FD123_2032 [Bacteroidetes bacterium]|nr:MAG: hypothetical protein FD123_2032 [Bacteroidota bacterium]